jgi:LPS-assembly protein
MRRWRVSVILVCLAAVVTAAPASARQGPPGFDMSRSWTSERVSKDHWKLVGDVEIERDDVKFFANEINIFTDTHMLTAKGNVVFTNGGTRVAADSAEFDYETKLGVFHHATGIATKAPPEGANPSLMSGPPEPDIYFRGETLEKIGDRRYKITHGGFTTCLQPTPRWELTSGTVILSLDHYALLTNSLFRVKGLPILYLPIIYYPINKEGRSTGILMPMYGSSSLKGTTLNNAFFWAISRSQDATFLYDWFSKTGQGFGADYRYVASPSSSGNVRFYMLREKAITTISSGTQVSQPGRRSTELRGNVNQSLPFRLRASARADYFTDVTVQQTYNTNVSDTSRRQRYFGGNVSGAWGTYSVAMALDHSEYFFDSQNSTLTGTLPRLSFNRADRPIFGSPLYFRVGGEYVSVLRKTLSAGTTQDFGLSRVDLTPSVRVPFNTWQFLTINSAVTFHYTRWSQSLDPLTAVQVKDPLSRTYVEVQARLVGPVLNRIWNLGGGYAEKLKHTIEPYVNLQRVSAINNFDRIVRIDSVDGVIGSATRITYGINSTLYAKRKIGDLPSRAMEIVSLAVAQTYYTDPRSAQYDAAYASSFGLAPPSRFSSMSIGVRATPVEEVNASLRAEYDTKFKAIRTMSAQGSWRAGRALNLNVGWSQRRYIPGLAGFNDPLTVSQYLNADGNFRISDNRFGGHMSINYDIAHKMFLQQRFVGYYNAQCCGFGIEYQNFSFAGVSFGGYRPPVTQDRRFNFTITLAGLGSFGNFFGGGLGGNQGAR